MKSNTPKQRGGTIVWSDEAIDAFEIFMQFVTMKYEKELQAKSMDGTIRLADIKELYASLM